MSDTEGKEDASEVRDSEDEEEEIKPKKKRSSSSGSKARRRAPIIDIPIELRRRSHRTPVKPTRYAEQMDKDEDKKKDEEEEDEEEEVKEKETKRPRKRAKKDKEKEEKVKEKEKEKEEKVKEEENEEEQEEEDEEDEEAGSKKKKPSRANTKRKNSNASEQKKPAAARQPAKRAKITTTWDQALNKSLAQECPDYYWSGRGGIEYINRSHPLKLVGELHHPGFIYGMVWSNDGTLLATCSTLGTIRIWDIETWQNIQELKDEKEDKIEEFYVMKFTPDDMLLFAAGKLKYRDKWSEEDDDNAVAPGPIKLFDVVTGEVVGRFDNHEEEILSLKLVTFKGENYLLSASQDGYIVKWHFDETWRNCLSVKRIDEVTTNMALSLSFLPNCGNKYFMCAADEGVKIYDFEHEVLLQRFDELYTSYCDCLKFVDAKEFDHVDGEYYIITRGVELLSQDDPSKVLQPNTCHLRKLTAPKKSKSSAINGFQLDTITTFMHPNYQANSWPVRATSNGRYMVAPTVQGEVFIWNLRTGDLVSILADHDRETRDITFHPTKPLMVTCGDDSTCKVYTQDPITEGQKIEEANGLVEVIRELKTDGEESRGSKRKAKELEVEEEQHFSKIETEWRKLEAQVSSIEKGWVELNKAKEKFNKEKKLLSDSKKKFAAEQKEVAEEKEKLKLAWEELEVARAEMEEAKKLITSLQEDDKQEKEKLAGQEEASDNTDTDKQKKEKRLLDAISKIQQLSQKKEALVEEKKKAPEKETPAPAPTRAKPGPKPGAKRAAAAESATKSAGGKPGPKPGPKKAAPASGAKPAPKKAPAAGGKPAPAKKAPAKKGEEKEETKKAAPAAKKGEEKEETKKEKAASTATRRKSVGSTAKPAPAAKKGEEKEATKKAAPVAKKPVKGAAAAAKSAKSEETASTAKKGKPGPKKAAESASLAGRRKSPKKAPAKKKQEEEEEEQEGDNEEEGKVDKEGEDEGEGKEDEAKADTKSADAEGGATEMEVEKGEEAATTQEGGESGGAGAATSAGEEAAGAPEVSVGVEGGSFDIDEVLGAEGTEDSNSMLI